MAWFTASLGVIILLGFIDISAAKDSCELYAAVGQQSLTLPFAYEGLANSHLMKWTHNSTIIFYREQGKVSVGKPQDVSATGSLLLKNLQFSSSGSYQAQVLYPNGTLVKTWTGRLCMMEKVSKPQLGYVCDFKSNAVNLNCLVAKPQGLVFSWTLDGKTLTSETRQTLSITLIQLKGETSFMCGVANKVSKETSDIVRPTCKSPPPPPPEFCFARQTVVAVLAGGTALILLLLTLTIVLCCCHRRNKTHVRHRNKGELRMLSLNKRDPDSISPEYETMRPTESSPPPSPQPSPQACYQKVSQPEVQSENSLPQLLTDAEGQKPSPVPKPRTKNPQTANM